MLAALIGFFMMPFLISNLGDHDYGIWLVATSLVGTYYLLDFGLAATVMRYAALSVGSGDVQHLSRVVTTALAIYALLATAVLLVTLVLGYLAPQWNVAANDASDFRHVILITGLSMALGFPFKAFAGILQARLRYDLLSSISLFKMIFSTACTIFLVLQGYGIVALAYIGLIAGLLSDLAFLAYARREAPGLEVRRSLFDLSLLRQLGSFSIWSFLIQLAGQLRFRIDALVIGSMRGATDVTQYTVGARLSEIPDGVLYQATNIVQPLLTGHFAEGKQQRMLETLSLYTRINAAFGVYVTGMLLILGEAFISRWMGAGYSNSIFVLYALTLTRCLGFILNPLDNSLYAIGKIQFLAAVNILDAAVNVALSIWLGGMYGIIGVALGTLIPMTATRLLFVMPYACRQLGWPLTAYLRVVGRPLLVGSVLICLSWLLYNCNRWADPGYVRIGFFALFCAAVYVPLVFWLGFSVIERATSIAGLQQAFLGSKPRRPIDTHPEGGSA
jgi:O-antigen/teichoic acid export membrane protein